jgi:hypothetical protein
VIQQLLVKEMKGMSFHADQKIVGNKKVSVMCGEPVEPRGKGQGALGRGKDHKGFMNVAAEFRLRRKFQPEFGRGISLPLQYNGAESEGG